MLELSNSNPGTDPELTHEVSGSLKGSSLIKKQTLFRIDLVASEVFAGSGAEKHLLHP